MSFIPMELLRGGTGVESNNPAINLANAARAGACELYRQAPQGIIPTLDNPLGQAVGAPFRLLMDNLCEDTGPLPAPPETPFTGGQCTDVMYRVDYNARRFPGESLPSTDFVLGPIGSPQFREFPNGVIALGYTYRNALGPQFFGVISSGGPGSQRPDTSEWRLLNFRVQRVSGADNCGNPAPSYPAVRPPGSGYGGNKPVKGPGGVIIPVPWKIPPIPFLPTGPIQIEPTLRVDIGDIKFEFDLRGAKILPIDINVPITIGQPSGGNNPNAPGSPSGGLDPISLADRFDRLEDLIEELEECACPEFAPLQLVQFASQVESFTSGQLPLKRNRYCAIQVTRPPSKSKIMDGNQGPDVIFAGWAWFLDGNGYASERMPVDAAGKIFKNPGGFTKFAFTLQKGARANAFELNVPLEE